MPLHPALIRHWLTAAVLLAGAASAAAEGEPGQFDFYVLALSWSPGWCATGDDPDTAQCAEAGRGFVVHGLWPQYERGYPEWCSSALSGWVDQTIVDSNRDMFPSGGLAGHQWRKHGLCTGLAAEDYFDLTRDALDRVALPKMRARNASPEAIEAAFAERNRELTAEGMSVQCRDGTLTEVRICLTRDLDFRPCAEVDRDTCPLPTVDVPSAG